MIHGLRQFTRLLKISAILARYRLDEFLEATHLYRPMRLLRVLAPWGARGVADKPRGERLRLALQEMGPIYVKFGQIVSTRRDLVPPDIADELALPPVKVHCSVLAEDAIKAAIQDYEKKQCERVES